MAMEFFEYRLVIEAVVIVAVAIGAYKAKGIVKTDNPGPANYKRPSMMSKETKKETEKIWDKTRLEETCDEIHKRVDLRLKTIETGVGEIKGEVKDIGNFLRNGKWE